MDAIMWQLDLASVKNLRMTAKSVARDCQSPGFTRFIANKTITLTEEGLNHIGDVAVHPVFGPCVRTIKLLVVFDDDSRWNWVYRKSRLNLGSESSSTLVNENLKLGEELIHREQQQTNLTTWLHEEAPQRLTVLFRQLGSLDILSLDTRTYQVTDRPNVPVCAVPDGSNWFRLWDRCPSALKIVLDSMRKSGVAISSLSAFDGNESFPVSGKIQSAALRKMVDSMIQEHHPKPIALKVRNLTLAFSTFTPKPVQADQLNMRSDANLICQPVAAGNTRAQHVQNYPGVADFLKLFPDLESLDLRMYNTLKGAPWSYSAVFQNIADEVRLPKLNCLVLRGIWTLEDSLDSFLKKHKTIEVLDLREVHITAGDVGWARILTRVATFPKLKKLHLEDLWDKNRHLVNLEPVNARFDGGMSFQTRGASGGKIVHTRDISMEEVKEGLCFKPSRALRSRGSSSLIAWLRNRRMLYGPPSVRS